MKRLVLFAVLALMQRAGPEPAITSAIDGVVKHSGTGDFLSNVVVSLNGQPGPAPTSTTDEKGRFSFKNVAAGSYRVQPQRDGYIRASKGSGPQTLTVVAGQDIHDVELNMIAAGTISGRIVDNTGQPLKGILVNTILVGYINGREAPITAIGAEPRPQTDDRGEYRLSGFSPGDYFIKAETPPSVSAAAPPRMFSYYPGTLNATSAVPVTLREGMVLDGINFKLQAPDSRLLRSISGKVMMPEDTVGSGIVGNFYLFPKDREAGADGNGYTILSTNRAESMSNGNFVLRDVPPGRYDVIAALSTTIAQRQYSRVEVVVGDKDVDSVSIPLSRKFDVKGRIVVEGAAASLALTSIRISITADFQLQTYTSPVDASGAFDFKDVAEGKYSVSVAAGLPSSAYVADIRQNSKSIFAGVTSPYEAVIDVNSQSSSASSIEIAVNSAGAAVTVAVQDAKSKPVAEAVVALVPEAPRRQTLMWFKTGASDDRGRITLNGVAPGYYRIFAWERTPLRAYQSADFLRDYETQGKLVSVDAGGRLDATVSVIPDDGSRPPRTFKNGASYSPAPADAISQTSAPAPSNPNNASVEGKVTRLKTGEPIAGVPVFVGDKVARSGPDGHYIINDVPPGTYSLSMRNAQSLGFFSPSQGGVPGSVTVKAKQHIDDLNFKLSAGGTVSGRVFDINGQPVKGAIMQLEAPTYQYAKRYMLSALIISRTDDRGEYRMSGVEPGEYYLRARLSGPLATTYFPGTSDANKARPVVVQEDGEIRGMDIAAQPASGYKISGRVLPVRAESPMSTSFYLIPRESSMADLLDILVQPTRNPATGEFEISNVRTGSYELFAFATPPLTAGTPFAIPESAYTARTRVDVGNQDVQGVTMELAAAVDIQGHIVIEGDDKTIQPNSVRMYLAAEEFSPAAIWLISSPRVNADGQFLFPKALPLRYSFAAEGIPEDAYIADIREGPTSIFDIGLRVGNKPPDPIEVVINPKGASIDGVVQGPDKKGIAFTTVVLVPQASRRGVASFYKARVTDEAGHFTFRGIAPGEYKVFAWEKSPSRAWRDPDYLAPFEELGSPVHIDPAAHVEDVSVGLIPKSVASSN